MNGYFGLGRRCTLRVFCLVVFPRRIKWSLLCRIFQGPYALPIVSSTNACLRMYARTYHDDTDSHGGIQTYDHDHDNAGTKKLSEGHPKISEHNLKTIRN